MTAINKETNKYRDMMFNGKLYMPKIVKIKEVYGDKVYDSIERMFSAMWNAYLKQGESGTVSLPYWAKQISNVKAMNIALKILSQNGWVTSVSLPTNNWGEARLNESKLLEYMTIEELSSVRKSIKFSKYVLKAEPEATRNNLIQMQGKTVKTGLVRDGFMKAGNTKFRFDVDMMERYKEEVSALVNKGIEKMAVKHPKIKDDLANYGNVGREIVEHYIWDGGTYSAGQGKIDWRGRDISGMLNKIGNPIGFKIMRSLLLIPEENRNVATASGLKHKYLFIAEILGYKNGNVAGKVNFGRRAYFNKRLLDLDLPNDLDDLYENIFLERMYSELDTVLLMSNWKKTAAIARFRAGTLTMTDAAKKIETFNGARWFVPAEIDASASILMIEGLLLNHKPFLNRTNVIGGTIQDAWGHETITNRLQFKSIMRICYGSSQKPADMWQGMGIEYNITEVKAFEDELSHGELAVADKFKNFLIQNSRMIENMTISVMNDTFDIKCNKYYNVGDVTSKFDFYDTYTHSIRRIHNTDTIKKPDLKRFRVSTPTTLVHCLDSQVADNTTNHIFDMYGWILPIHDALILDVEAIDDAKDIYCSGKTDDEPSLEKIHRTRNTILGKYFTSIGISSTKVKDWKQQVASFVQPYKGKRLKVNRIALK